MANLEAAFRAIEKYQLQTTYNFDEVRRMVRQMIEAYHGGEQPKEKPVQKSRQNRICIHYGEPIKSEPYTDWCGYPDMTEHSPKRLSKID